MSQATQVLRATQQAALTPRLQQSVRLLQLSSNDFAEELEQALATNPFLEVPSPATASGSAVDHDGWRNAPPDARASDVVAHVSDGDVDDSLDRFGGVDLSSIAAHESDRYDHTAFGRSSSGSSFDGDEFDVGATTACVQTLRMHLHGELVAQRLTERQRMLASLVIEALDDDGQLRQALSDVVARFEFDPPVHDDEMALALARVQQLGPPGIAARSVAESLTLQLDALAEGTSSLDEAATIAIAVAMVDGHLERVATRDWAGIARRLDLDMADVVRAAALIRSLDPRPGSAFDDTVAQSIVPDVIVRRTKGGWHADINPAVIPRLSLNRVYAALFRDARGGDRQPLGQQLQEARWLLRNAAQRFVTIRRVARVIVAEQAAFLDYGDIAIRPLLLRQVADRLDVHESTISRAIGNKFMATPRGIFPFKHFFSRKLATVSGGTCSAASIRAAMRELIDGEDTAHPLSDVDLARALTGQGLCVARRTVTKYRGLMRIEPVEMRRAADRARSC